MVTFAGATAARIGEVSGVRAHDIDMTTWTWNVRNDGRLFVGPRDGRLTTAILRDATHWDEVVESIGLGYRLFVIERGGLTSTRSSASA